MIEGTASFSRKPSDVDNVAWALSTAESLWSRGERLEALRWVRRAAEEASDAGDDDRALELAKLASELSARFSTPPPTAVAPPPSTVVPTPAPVANRPSAIPVPRPSMPKSSLASTLPAARHPSGRLDPEPTMMSGGPEPTMMSGGPEPTMMSGGSSSPQVPSEPPTTRDTNPPTEGFADEKTVASSAGNAAANLPAASQAIRVFVVRDGRGARVLPALAGAPPPQGAVEAMLVALSPGADWRRLLG